MNRSRLLTFKVALRSVEDAKAAVQEAFGAVEPIPNWEETTNRFARIYAELEDTRKSLANHIQWMGTSGTGTE